MRPKWVQRLMIPCEWLANFASPEESCYGEHQLWLDGWVHGSKLMSDPNYIWALHVLTQALTASSNRITIGPCKCFLRQISRTSYNMSCVYVKKKVSTKVLWTYHERADTQRSVIIFITSSSRCPSVSLVTLAMHVMQLPGLQGSTP